MTARLRRIVVTGAGGFVGGHLCAALAAHDPTVELIGTGLTGDRVGVPLDLTDAAAVSAFIASARPDAIVHLAAQASVAIADAGCTERTFAVNLGGTLNLALAVARHKPDTVVLFSSSSEVYGRSFGTLPVDEDATPQPMNVYARSKLMAEMALAEVLPAMTPLVIARAFNHTGAGQRETFVLPSFAGQIARMESGAQAPVLKVGNLDAQRDFLDVRDVVAAYVKLLATAARLPTRCTFNIATGTARPLGTVLDMLRRKARVDFAVEVDSARLRSSDIPHAAGSYRRLSLATGWTPAIALDDTLTDLLDHARRETGRR